MRYLLAVLFLAPLYAADTVPLGAALTKGDVTVVAVKCCMTTTRNFALIPSPLGFMVSVATKNENTDHFVVSILVRDKDGTELRLMRTMERDKSIAWASEMFTATKDSVLISIEVIQLISLSAIAIP
jgi:hypothetical protein